MSEKIYAISSGEYEEYHIDYTFLSKEERNSVLELLNEGREGLFQAENFEKCDKEFKLDEIKHFVYAKCHYSVAKGLKCEFLKGNSLQEKLILKEEEACGNNEVYFYRIMSESELDTPNGEVTKMLIEEAKEKIGKFKG